MKIKTTKPSEVFLFTDGASSGNPGPGGWAAILVVPSLSNNAGQTVSEFGGAVQNTTNNQMELRAVIEGLKEARAYADHKITVYTDSSYVKKGATEWLANWIEQNWRSKITKKEILNKDLWQELARELSAKQEDKKSVGEIKWHLVGGHVGVPGNERADKIATGFALGRVPKLFSGKIADYKTEHKIDILDISEDAFATQEKSTARRHSSKKAYSYVSLVDGEVETHKNWADCERRVKGVSGARFKKATNAEEERGIIAEFKNSISH